MNKNPTGLDQGVVAPTGPLFRREEHALAQMAARRVTRDEVEASVRELFAARRGHSGRVNYFRTIAGYRVRVTIAQAGRERVVVTVWKEPLL